MKLEINLNNNLLDYVDEEELEEDIKSEVRSQIKFQIKTLIEENKTELQKELINKIIKELLNEIDFGIGLKDLLYNKIIEGINERYKEPDAYHMTYDMDIDQIIKNLYQQNRNQIDLILIDKINYALENYKVNDYVLAEQLSNILTSNEKYINALKEMLENRLYDIIDKL